MRRRQFLKSSSTLLAALLAAGFLDPLARAEEWNKAAFESKNLEDLIKLLGGAQAEESEAVTIVAPDIAENGAVVPIGVSSSVAKAEAIALLVEKNPNMLAAIFFIPQGTLPELQTRVKMAMTSNVFAMVKADGKFHYAGKEIKVTLGGCGG
jgi:sulfur-oxidizing protein SoxY